MPSKNASGCLSLLGLGIVVWFCAWAMTVPNEHDFMMGCTLIMLLPTLVFGANWYWKHYRDSRLAQGPIKPIWIQDPSIGRELPARKPPERSPSAGQFYIPQPLKDDNRLH